jgi:hypothetical protein
MRAPPVFLGRDYHQMCWVVDDLDAAMKHWTETCGVGPFYVIPHVKAQHVTYRGKPAELDFSGALAQAGRIQIELIQQHCDNASVYRDLIPKGRSGFHHIAMFALDYDRELAEYERQGLPVVTAGVFGDIRFAYIDATPVLGTVLELTEDSPTIRQFFQKVVDGAKDWDGRDPVRPAA